MTHARVERFAAILAIRHSVFNPSWALADDPTGRSLACRPGQSLHPLSADQLANRLAAIDDLHRTAPRGRVLGVDVDPHGLGHGRDHIHDADRPVGDVYAVPRAPRRIRSGG